MRWSTLRYWTLSLARLRQREHLALRLWPYLPAPARSSDDATPLRLISRVVRAIEAGHDDFTGDAEAAEFWQRARQDETIQQTAGALRTLQLQLTGDANAAGLQVEPATRRTLKSLRKDMYRDNLTNELAAWLQAPVTLPLLSVLLLFSGWLFNSIFLGKFGLPVGRYFGLSDYLAASVEGLLPALFAVGFTFVIQWFVRHRIRLQALQRHLGLAWLALLPSIAGFALAYPAVFLLFPDAAIQRLLIVYLTVLAVPLLTIPYWLGFSQKPARDTVLLNFFVIFCAVVWFSAEIRFLRVLQGGAVSSEVTLINAPDQALRWRVLSGNSLYLFLLSDSREVVAVPVQQVLSVRYLNLDAEGLKKMPPAVEAVAPTPATKSDSAAASAVPANPVAGPVTAP